MRSIQKKNYAQPRTLILEVETLGMLANSLKGNGGDNQTPLPDYGDNGNSEDL